MTGAQLIDNLGYRLEDASERVFEVNQRIEALNDSQRTLMGLMHDFYLSDLKTKVSEKTVSSGEVSFGSLFWSLTLTGVTASAVDPTVFTKANHGLETNDVVELSGFSEMTEINGMTGTVQKLNANTFEVNGIAADPAETTGGTVIKVDDGGDRTHSIRNGIYKVYDRTNSVVAKIVDEKDFPSTTDYSYGTICCTSDEKLLISPTTCVSVDVYYIKEPTAIANDSSECELNSSLETILLDLAESMLFRADNDLQRASLDEKKAFDQIKTLNERVGAVV